MSLSLSNNHILLLDIEKNPWIKDIDISQNKEYLNNLINIGYNVSKAIKFQDPSNDLINQKLEDLSNLSNNQIKFYNEQNKHKMDFINQKLDNLNQTMQSNTSMTRNNLETNSERVFQMIKEITGKTNVSAHKGQIGENYIFNTLDQAYPDANIESLVSTPHQSDIHLKLEDFPQIFIESKNYTNNVPKKEILKFKDDLDRNNCDFGIFYSFNYKITGIHSRLYVEDYNNKKILYVSKIEFNKSDVIFPIEVMKYIIKNNKPSNIIDTKHISRKAESIIKIVGDLEELYTENCKNMTIVEEQRTNIVKSLDLIQQNALRNYVNTKSIVEQIRDRVSKELIDFVKTNLVVDNIPIDISDLSEKNQKLINGFFTILPTGYITKRESNEISCYYNNNLKLKVSLGKTKIKCKIIDDDCVISLSEKNICKIPKYL